MFLVTGANGQLGNELKLLLQDKAAYVDRDELDITDEEAVKAYVGQGKWDAIINCAAYTAVDKAESDEALAEKLMSKALKIWQKRAFLWFMCRQTMFLTAQIIVLMWKRTRLIRSLSMAKPNWPASRLF